MTAKGQTATVVFVIPGHMTCCKSNAICVATRGIHE